jgi:hypothetical protein
MNRFRGTDESGVDCVLELRFQIPTSVLPGNNLARSCLRPTNSWSRDKKRNSASVVGRHGTQHGQRYRQSSTAGALGRIDIQDPQGT